MEGEMERGSERVGEGSGRSSGEDSDLQDRGQEDRAAHQGEDHDASDSLLPNSQEVRLLAWCSAL